MKTAPANKDHVSQSNTRKVGEWGGIPSGRMHPGGIRKGNPSKNRESWNAVGGEGVVTGGFRRGACALLGQGPSPQCRLEYGYSFYWGMCVLPSTRIFNTGIA